MGLIGNRHQRDDFSLSLNSRTLYRTILLLSFSCCVTYLLPAFSFPISRSWPRFCVSLFRGHLCSLFFEEISMFILELCWSFQGKEIDHSWPLMQETNPMRAAGEISWDWNWVRGCGPLWCSLPHPLAWAINLGLILPQSLYYLWHLAHHLDPCTLFPKYLLCPSTSFQLHCHNLGPNCCNSQMLPDSIKWSF